MSKCQPKKIGVLGKELPTRLRQPGRGLAAVKRDEQIDPTHHTLSQPLEQVTLTQTAEIIGKWGSECRTADRGARCSTAIENLDAGDLERYIVWRDYEAKAGRIGQSYSWTEKIMLPTRVLIVWPWYKLKHVVVGWLRPRFYEAQDRDRFGAPRIPPQAPSISICPNTDCFVSFSRDLPRSHLKLFGEDPGEIVDGIRKSPRVVVRRRLFRGEEET